VPPILTFGKQAAALSSAGAGPFLFAAIDVDILMIVA
jgi:hypothetical protein